MTWGNTYRMTQRIEALERRVAQLETGQVPCKCRASREIRARERRNTNNATYWIEP